MRLNIVFLILASLLLVNAAYALETTISTIDSTDNSGFSTSISNPGSNNIYITYLATAAKELRFAKSTNNGQSWATSAIDSQTDVLGAPSHYAKDAQKIAVSYWDSVNKDLKLAISHDSGQTWETSVVDSAGDVGFDSSVYYTGDTILIAYKSSTNSDLKFANSSKLGQTWDIKTIDTQGDVGSGVKMDVIGNNIFLVYRDATAGQIKFTKSANGGDTWETRTVTSDNGQWMSIDAVDVSNIYISYGLGNEIKFARSTDGGNTWSISRIASGQQGSQSKWTSLYAANTQTLFVTYNTHVGATGTTGSSSLLLGTSINGGQSWNSEIVELGGENGEYNSVTLSRDAQYALISYYRRLSTSSGELKFARVALTGTSPQPTTDTDSDGDPDNTDCQPQNPSVNHAAQDINDGIDNNCNGIVDDNLPKYWNLAILSDNAGYGAGIIAQVPVFSGHSNTLRINDPSSSSRNGVESDKIMLGGQNSIIVSADIYCTQGTGSASIIFYNSDGTRVGTSSVASSKNNEWERVFFSAGVPQSAASASVVLSSGSVGGTSDCYFDDAQLQSGVLSEENVAPPFVGYSFGVSSISSCCPSDRCWDGLNCVANMAGNASALPSNNYRCINGQWLFSPVLKTPDGLNSGYCPVSTQCLLDAGGNSSSNDQPETYYLGKRPQCISTGQFVMDNYCIEHEWTTRTKFLALKMLELVQETGNPSNYTLYCDNYKSALPSNAIASVEQYLGGGTNEISQQSCFSGVEGDCVNNFCILDYSEGNSVKRALGVSLNKDIDDPQKSFLNTLGLSTSYCNSLTGEGDFKKCSNDVRLWYNPELNMAIYGISPLSLEGPSAWQMVISWLTGPVNLLVDWITGYEPLTNINADYSFAQQTKKFSKIYLSNSGTAHIAGIQEDVGEDKFLLVNYGGLGIPICDYMQNKLFLKGINEDVSTQSMVCTQISDDNFNVFSDDPHIVALWQEFTSLLRVR